MLEQKVIHYIEEKQLFTRQDQIVVALSGGADSVALLRILLHNGYSCIAAHCNFHLRGEESNRDEKFVRSLCEALDTPLQVIHFDTLNYAATKKISLEMAARELRYKWFEDIRKQYMAKVTAVAHHRDDAVETFLLNLIRGTGIDGLQGIKPKNGTIVRPLLCIDRKDIMTYLQSIGQTFVTDSSNLEDNFTRNKLRLHIIPMLQEINPSVSETIIETTQRLADVSAIYHTAIDQACKRIMKEKNCFDIAQLLIEAAPQTVLFELLRPYGFNAAQIKDLYRNLLTNVCGKLFHSDNYTLLRDRNYLYIQARNSQTPTPHLTLHTEIKEIDSSFIIPKDATVACIDADKVQIPLTLRKWKSGDRFMPLGMKHFKKVRNYLRDRKYSLFEKENQYVVCERDNIIWLVNERIDNRYSITPNTRRIIILRVSGFK